MDQIVMALTSKHAVAIGLYSHVQYTFSCSPLVADSQLSCKFKPSQDPLRQDEYKRQPPEWHGLLVDQDLYQNATVDPWMSAAAKPCQPDWRRSITVLLMKYFHFPHMLMLWEFAFGVIIHCLIPTVCVTHARWPFILCRFLTREAIGRTSHSFSKTLELLTLDSNSLYFLGFVRRMNLLCHKEYTKDFPEYTLSIHIVLIFIEIGIQIYQCNSMSSLKSMMIYHSIKCCGLLAQRVAKKGMEFYDFENQYMKLQCICKK